MAPPVDPESVPEFLWNRLRHYLSGKHGIGIAQDGLIPSLVDLYGLLSPSRRDYVAEQMVVVLKTISPGVRFSDLQLNVLAIVHPFLTNSDHRMAAKTIIARLFEPGNWSSYSDPELDALATAAPLLGANPLIDVWLQFLRRRGDQTVGIALIHAARAQLSALTEITRELGLTPVVERAIKLAHASFRKKYSPAEISKALTDVLQYAPPSGGDIIKKLLQRIQIDSVPIRLSKPIDIFREHTLWLSRNPSLRIAAQLGGELVTTCDADPASAMFRAEYKELALKYVRYHGTEADRMIGEFLRGAASAHAEIKLESLRAKLGNKTLKDILFQKIDPLTLPLEALVDRVCQSAKDRHFRLINIDYSEYHEGRAIRCLLEPLIETDDVRLTFTRQKWSPSGKDPVPQDVLVRCKRQATISTEDSEFFLYEFKGHHVFARRDWLEATAARTDIPRDIGQYLRTLVKTDFNIQHADLFDPELGIGARAWLALAGGANANGGAEFEFPVSVLEQAAKFAKLQLPRPRYRRQEDSDSVFQGLISGALQAAVVGAIHGDLLSNWWNKELLPNAVQCIPIFSPEDFAKAMGRDHYYNYGVIREAEPSYRLSWANLLKTIGNIFSQLPLTGAPADAEQSLSPEAKDFILDLMLTALSPSNREIWRSEKKPRMRWAFVCDRTAVSRLFTYNNFSVPVEPQLPGGGEPTGVSRPPRYRQPDSTVH